MWDEKEVRERTDNYDKVMDRTWYLISNNFEGADKMTNNEFFVENYFWNKKGETAFNHTYETKTKDHKLIDYGKWNVTINKDGFYM